MTGGLDSDYLDNTELFDSSLGIWAISGAKLPQPMFKLRAANIDNRVLIFGNSIFSCEGAAQPLHLCSVCLRPSVRASEN